MLAADCSMIMYNLSSCYITPVIIINYYCTRYFTVLVKLSVFFLLQVRLQRRNQISRISLRGEFRNTNNTTYDVVTIYDVKL